MRSLINWIPVFPISIFKLIIMLYFPQQRVVDGNAFLYAHGCGVQVIGKGQDHMIDIGLENCVRAISMISLAIST